MSRPAPVTALPSNVLPLDAIRFISALWVCLYHGVKFPGIRLFPYFDLSWDCVLFGGTGVLAFFIISGFCIHYPAVAREKDPQWGSFLTRRYVRVILPYLAVLPFAFWTGRQYNMFTGNDLAWTILCDLAYYSLYPILYYAGKKIGWTWLLIISMIFSAVGSYLNTLPQLNVGNALLIPIFLPVWIMGCLLGEIYVKRMQAGPLVLPAFSLVVFLRVAMLVITPVLALLSYYRIIYWQNLAVLVSFPILLWIWIEIRHFSAGRKVPLFLAWAGTWIYSLYLTHPITQRGIDIVLESHFPEFNALLHSHFFWLSLRFGLMVGATFLAAYIFAFVIEFPSHHLARWLSRRVKF